MDNILVISRFAPYDKVPHAGGKVHNFNIKNLNKDSDYDVKLLTFCKQSEIDHIDHSKYDIKSDLVIMDREYNSLGYKILKFYYKYNYFSKYGCMREGYILKTIKSYLKEYKRRGYSPKVIILEWTQIVIYSKEIKKIFPKSKIIAIEHDVTFQSYERQMELKENIIKKKIFRIRFNTLKKIELEALKVVDGIITLNDKDKLMLKDNGICNKIQSIVPYYDDLSNYNINFKNENLIFYGKMDRPENYLSCIWFIENIFKKVIKEFPNLKFYIVGYNPPKELIKFASDNIIITGFVDNPRSYFEKCSVLVAPLLLGAGIKIKVLEAMSAGVVVLTNKIGIEGIPAKDKEHYFYCDTPEDYKRTLKIILNGKVDFIEVSKNAKELLRESFNISDGYEKLKKMIDGLL